MGRCRMSKPHTGTCGSGTGTGSGTSGGSGWCRRAGVRTIGTLIAVLPPTSWCQWWRGALHAIMVVGSDARAVALVSKYATHQLGSIWYYLLCSRQQCSGCVRSVVKERTS